MTEEFDPDAEGPSAALRVDGYVIDHIRVSVPDEILSIFRDEQWQRTYHDTNLFGGREYRYDLVTPLAEATARLSVYGLNARVLRQAIGRARTELKRIYRNYSDAGQSQQLCAFVDAIRSPQQLVPLVAARIAGNWRLVAAGEGKLPLATNLLSVLHRYDPRLIVLICAAAQPEANLVLNVTNLVSSKGKEDWWLRPNGKSVCSGAVSRLAATAGMPPVLVLTEGPTDTRNLRAGFDLLRPDVADLFEFLNRTPKPQQNAVEVTNMAKQFSASEPSRKIVALYDNDGAGLTQLKIAQKSKLGKGVILVNLPDIKTARSYPTLAAGAPSTAIKFEDVNKRACGIEIYLGPTALTDSSGSLIPVRWSPAAKGAPTQGHLERKSAVQKAFDQQVADVRSGKASVASFQWGDLKTVIDAIVAAVSK